MIQGYAIPNATMLGNNGAYKSEFYKALEGAKAAGATVEDAPCLLARGVNAYNAGLPNTPSLLIVPQFYKAGNLYQDVPPFVAEDSTMRFTVTRATTATRVNSSGLIESVASGVPRIDWLGQSCPALLVEASGQNQALWSRDLSVSGTWAASGITAVRNAVGADGAESGATTLTSTAASATITQNISHASQSRIFSAYMRRVSGTGQIQLTTNGGTNWQTVTLTSAFAPFNSGAQTVASGQVGIRMIASGDVIEVDFTQAEVGPVPTSPITTTIAAVSRAADVCSVSGVSGYIGQTQGTIYAEVDVRILGDGRFASVSDGTTNNRIQCRFNVVNNGVDFVIVVSGASVGFSISNSTHPSFPATIPAGTYKIALAYKQNDYVVAMNGTTYTPSVTSRNVPLNFSKVTIGADVSDLNQFNNRIRAAALYTTRLSNDQLANLTRLT